ncbi:unnamed protein product [Adineta ricciae]|uniref:Poly [ADP-ribose] polymerase n=1 Tax=Adineta ricciae TaxID=249248 RepID=A0A815N6D1_ADIRI|nr:unnamed protein product [Adineta ricciae]
MKRCSYPTDILLADDNLSKRRRLEADTINDHSTSNVVNDPTLYSEAIFHLPTTRLNHEDGIVPSYGHLNNESSSRVTVSNGCLHDSNTVQQTTVTTTVLPETTRGEVVTGSISIHQGDLIAEDTDVIVVCRSSRTIRESVLEAGGYLMKLSYNNELNNSSTDPVISIAATGQVCARKAYFLAWKPSVDADTLRQSVSTFICDAMSKAASENVRSIAFPAIGCGGYGCTISLIAQTMVEAISQQLTLYPMAVSVVTQSDRTDVCNEFRKQVNLFQSTSQTESVALGIGTGMIEVQMGDITQQNVDVIIGSSSSRILRRSIMSAAGADVQMAYGDQCEKNPSALIVSLQPGRLPCKQIFFVKWQPDSDEKLLQQSLIDFVWTVIQNVISYKYTSVAFPAIGCGNHACSVDLVAKTIINEIKHQLNIRNIPLSVKFIVLPGRQNVYDEFSKQVVSLNEDSRSSISRILPSNWTQSADNSLRCLVPFNTQEYNSIANDFDQTMNGRYTSILRIERIQNVRWFVQYFAHSREFNKRLNENTERRLYHGCSHSAADSIIQDCFNRSFAGTHGATYGVGLYFSSNAAYCSRFCEANLNGERCMFVARVLIGRATQGDRSIRSRPIGFDSTTDGNHIFVVYHDAQAYAEYLITFK